MLISDWKLSYIYYGWTYIPDVCSVVAYLDQSRKIRRRKMKGIPGISAKLSSRTLKNFYGFTIVPVRKILLSEVSEGHQ